MKHLFMFFVCLALVVPAFGQVPNTISYQGLLTTTSGAPIPNGDHGLQFDLYDTSSGGTSLWTETYASLSIQQGSYKVILGSVNPLSIPFDRKLYLEITINSGPGISSPVVFPRSEFTSAPYALQSQSLLGPGSSVSGVDAVAGGRNNQVHSDYSVIAGGESNLIEIGSSMEGRAFSKGTAKRNTILGAYSTISGGRNNKVSSQYGSIGGGQANEVTAPNAAVGGGQANEATAPDAAVGGGSSNTASGEQSTVSGGAQNIAQETGSAVGGGSGNKARGQYSVVSGGGGATDADSNSATGNYTSIPGGRANQASGSYSLAAGRRAKANHSGSFVWADSTDEDFVSTAPNQFLIRASGGVGIGTTGLLYPGAKLNIQGPAGNSILKVNPDVYPGIAGIHLSTGPGANGWSIRTVGGAPSKLEFYDVVSSNARVRIDVNGQVGIGFDDTPDAQLDVEASLNTVAVFNRRFDDGVVIGIQQDDVTEGTISVSGTTVSYNAFTGSHYGSTDEAIEMGTLVSFTGSNKRFHGNEKSEIIYGITASSRANDPACLGAYLALQESSQPEGPENPHLVMAVGNGEMWVADDGKNIEPGDYLISSDVRGHAMKDDEEKFPIGHVVARAAEKVDWSSVSESIDGRKHKKISVLFGNFVRSSVTNLTKEVQELRAMVKSLVVKQQSANEKSLGELK